jgi:hypothetical protein
MYLLPEFLGIIKPNQRFFPKTLLSGLLTLCPVNNNYESLFYLENSGRRYILKIFIFFKMYLLPEFSRYNNNS